MRAFYMAPLGLLVPRTGERIAVGETVEVTGPVVLCSHGLHASPHVLDAVSYRNVGCLTLVEIGGEIADDDNKIAGTSRTTLAVLSREQTERVLRHVACNAAEMAIGWSGEDPDQRSVDAIDCARRYADGLATRDEWAAARAAARAAAGATAGAAEWDAARAAARAAEWAAAGAAAGDAAWDAAWAAARAAEWDAAWDALHDMADRCVLEAMSIGGWE